MEPNTGLGAPADPNRIQLPTWRVVIKPVGSESYMHTNIVVWQCFLLYRIKFIRARLPIILYYTLVHTVWASPSGVLSGSIVVLWFRGPDTMQYHHPLVPLNPPPFFFLSLLFSMFLAFSLKMQTPLWKCVIYFGGLQPTAIPPSQNDTQNTDEFKETGVGGLDFII